MEIEAQAVDLDLNEFCTRRAGQFLHKPRRKHVSASAAIRSPVAITKHRKPKFVLMSMDQYQQLARDGTQQVHMLDEMADDLRELMIEGLERDLKPDEE